MEENLKHWQAPVWKYKSLPI